jgi:hypothetical protein
MIKVEVGLCRRYSRHYLRGNRQVWRLVDDSSVLLRGVRVSVYQLMIQEVTGPATAVARFIRNCQAGCIDIGIVDTNLAPWYWTNARLVSIGPCMHSCGFAVVERMTFNIVTRRERGPYDQATRR